MLQAKSNAYSRCFENRAQLNINASAVGRSGEIKFQDYSLWEWDPYLNVTDIKWGELKTIERHAMPMVPDSRYFIDFYHSMGAFWMMEKGLLRSPQQIEHGMKNVVFPSLQSVNSESVGKKMTNIIRNNLPAGTPDAISKQFSGKSTRSGAISAMCKHRNMNMMRLCTRSDHSHGIDVDSYIDKADVVAGIPAALAVHGSKDLDADVAIYGFDAVGSPDVSPLIDEMFPCSVERFKDGGCLRHVLVNAAASLVCFHNEVTRDLGFSNALSKKMRDIARKVNLADPRFPNSLPETVLEEWSNRMMADFNSRSACARSTEPDLASIADSLSFITGKLNEMGTSLRSLSLKQDDLLATVAHQKMAIANLQQENAALRRAKEAQVELHHQQHRLKNRKIVEQLLSSPPPRKRLREEELQIEERETVSESEQIAIEEDAQQAERIAATAAAAVPADSVTTIATTVSHL